MAMSCLMVKSNRLTTARSKRQRENELGLNRAHSRTDGVVGGETKKKADEGQTPTSHVSAPRVFVERIRTEEERWPDARQ